ncbi:MAG: hypothetical protein ACT4NL_02045 [Pseudomarimonas sp.]
MIIRWNSLHKVSHHSKLREEKSHGSHEAGQPVFGTALLVAKVAQTASELEVKHGQTLRHVGVDRVLMPTCCGRR